MPAKDIIHEAVKAALVKDSWRITHDPLTIPIDKTHIFVDLGADRPLAAEKEGHKIAIEIKSFVGLSVMGDLQQSLGQYQIYALLLQRVEPDRELYLAISDTTFKNVFEEGLGQLLIAEAGLKIVAVNIERQEVTKWTS